MDSLMKLIFTFIPHIKQVIDFSLQYVETLVQVAPFIRYYSCRLFGSDSLQE